MCFGKEEEKREEGRGDKQEEGKRRRKRGKIKEAREKGKGKREKELEVRKERLRYDTEWWKIVLLADWKGDLCFQVMCGEKMCLYVCVSVVRRKVCCCMWLWQENLGFHVFLEDNCVSKCFESNFSASRCICVLQEEILCVGVDVRLLGE